MRYVKPLNLFHDLLTSKAVKRGRLLGLDVGDKFVGLAISDTHNTIASHSQSMSNELLPYVELLNCLK